MFGLWHEPSAVCRLSVTLLHPSQRLELFENVFAPPNSSETRTVCVNILGKNSTGSMGSCKLNTRDMKNWRFSTNISLYFENGKIYDHSYHGRRIGTRMRSIE